jgi:RNA polymerase sigma factor (sigma-70 family)
MDADAAMRATSDAGSSARDAAGSFDPFFRAWFPAVARSAALVARDRDAGPDLAQEAFARVYERWTGLASVDHARNLAFRAAINLAKTHRTRSIRSSPAGLDAGLGSGGPSSAPRAAGTDPSDHESATTERLTVLDALGALSARQRACVVLVDYADLETSVAASLLGTAEATVRVHLRRGRAKLRERLTPSPEEES